MGSLCSDECSPSVAFGRSIMYSKYGIKLANEL